MASHRRAPRRGALLIELVLTLAILAIVARIAVPKVATMLDRAAVNRARHDVVLGLWAARNVATMRGTYASFVVDGPRARVHVLVGADTAYARDLAARSGVTVSVTRDSITFGPAGIGYGAANTRIVVSRGRRADTITTSRLGRVSY